MIIPDINLRKFTFLTNLDSNTFATVFHHGDTFYTTVFPLGDFIYFTFMLAAGFVFVNVVTLQCKRSSPFWDHHMQPYSFWKTIFIAAPTLFFLSSMYMLRARKDQLSYCEEGKSDGCTIFTRAQVFHYNWQVWTLGYLIGLQFSHLDQGIFQEFRLDWKIMKHWPAILWVIFFAMIGVFAFLINILAHKYLEFKLAFGYIGWVGLVGLWLYWKSIGASDIHIHHYCVSAFMITLIGYQSVLLSFVQAIMCGVMVEGASRWGYDRIFTYEQENVPR